MGVGRTERRSRPFVVWLVIVALAAAFVTAFPVSSRAELQARRVLMLHSFGLRFKPWTEYAQIIRSEISKQSKNPVDFHDHSLVTARLADEKSDGPFVDYLHALYSESPPALIIAIGAPAANFVQRYRAQLFPETPMLFTAVEARRVQYDRLTKYDTVVAVQHDFPAIFENILRVLPDTRTIAMVNGASPNETFWLGELRRELAPFNGRVEFKWYNDWSFEAILKDAASLPPHSAIFWHLMNVDAAGVAHEATSALNRLAAVSNAPIFSYDDGFFGEALVGGPMHSVTEGSLAAAAVALRILAGEKAGDIKAVPTTFAPPKFDWRQLQHWHISERLLPPGSQIFFREPNLWEQYSWQIAFILAIILIQAGLITVLLHEHRRRRLAEVQSRQRMAELAHINRFSTAGELTASIAHEINQPLAAILANAEAAQIMLQSPRPDLAELGEIVGDIVHDDRRIGEVIRRMRSLLKKAPFELKKIDLNEVVRETAEFLSAVAISRVIDLTSSTAI